MKLCLKKLCVGFLFIATLLVSNVYAAELYTQEQEPELYCLAENIYWESHPDNLAGRAAVADVVLNRVADTRFPNTICEVVRQGLTQESWRTKGKEVSDVERIYNPVRNMCQFSWWCDGKPDIILNKDGKDWRNIQELAYKIFTKGYLRGISDNATHYHAPYVHPEWNKRFEKKGRIGMHLFYRQN